ncbi:MAG: hypothetical protein M1377_02930 [Deltaproteobacteria bacterium]|nr:hypothetical protein [Deltaproteobacteria bacterium]
MKRAAWFIPASVGVLACASAMPAMAEDRRDVEAAEIPAYSVARIRVSDGSAWVRTSDGEDWEEYPTNSPLPPRSRVSIPEGSEAELQFHGGLFVLLSSGTDMEIRDLLEGNCSFRLRSGEIRFDLPADDFAPVSVRVPGGSGVRFLEPGRYWLTVTDDDETRLVVRGGKAIVTQEDGEFRVAKGEEATIGRGVSIGKYEGGGDDYASPPPPSDAERQVNAPPPVVEELREYGDWVYAPAYGYVWRPHVATGWSPYVYGRWVWISPYGWTWVSNEPWGWYPYRCGYWVDDPAFGWVWTPFDAFVSVNFFFGPFHHFHHNVFFLPSTVRFIPEGRSVRWIPLRPGERFRPVEFRRGDARLSQWNRPLEGGRVFVRSGDKRHIWRDVAIVRAERQSAVLSTRPAGELRPDTRPVRPELKNRFPAGGRTVETPRAVPRETTPARPEVRVYPNVSPGEGRPAVVPEVPERGRGVVGTDRAPAGRWQDMRDGGGRGDGGGWGGGRIR